MNKYILVTGGYGFIGKAVVKTLEKNYKIIVVDDLSTGTKLGIKKNIFFQENLNNKEFIQKLFKKYNIKIIVHLAASTSVEESYYNKKKYISNNFLMTKNIIDYAIKYLKLEKFIFSSTAMVYKDGFKKFNETDSIKSSNNYALSKIKSEKYIKKKFKNENTKFYILRFFNVIGADYKNKIGLTDKSSKHIFTNLFKSYILKKNFVIFGNNYDTADGTAVRDYINVMDIADIVNFLIKKKKLYSNVFNCGYGKGYTVFEMIKRFQIYFNYKFVLKVKKKRPGDVAYLVCNNEKIKKLGWKPKYTNLDNCFNESYKYFRKYFFSRN